MPKSLSSCLVAVLLAACSGGAPDAGQAQADPVEAVAPEPTCYVIASRLNLRGGASAEAPLLGKLDINSPVVMLSSDGSFAQVRAGNGTEGWVSAEYLADERLDFDAAVQEARDHTDKGGAAAGLPWWQRAAAIYASDRTVLRGLADAYRASGDEETAARVERRLKWPEGVVPVVWRSDGRIEVERVIGWWEGLSGRELPSPLTAEQVQRFSLESPESWWVLPDVGPAVPAAVASLAGDVRTRTLLRPEAGGWAASAVWELPIDEWQECGIGDCGLQRVNFELPDGGTLRETGRDNLFVDFPVLPLARRDIDGDGRVDVVQTDDCATYIEGADGALVASTAFRCCGC